MYSLRHPKYRKGLGRDKGCGCVSLVGGQDAIQASAERRDPAQRADVRVTSAQRQVSARSGLRAFLAKAVK